MNMLGQQLRAVWWWIDRWRASVAYRTLTLEAQGLHRELVTAAMRRGGRLPNSPDILRRVAGCAADEWKRSWPVVARFWRAEADWLLPGPEVRLYVSRYRRCPPLVERTRRREIPMAVRRTVFERDGRTCRFCGATQRPELDHIQPWSHGGPDTVENLRVLCKPCNIRRGAPLEED
jgi:hypothetical protein